MLGLRGRSRPRTGVAAAVLLAGAAAAASESSEGALFRDVTAETGVRFEYFNGMAGDYLMPEIVGGGVAVFDADGDGDMDLFFTQGAMLRGELGEALRPPGAPPRDRLFLNQPSERGVLRFVDATAASGIEGGGYGIGVAAGDFDADGRTDLYVTELGGNRLWRNLGGGRFADMTREAGVRDERWSVPAVFFDYDRDGRLDLFVGNYVDYSPDEDKTCRTATGRRDYCGPFSYPPSGDRLLRNLGDGRFRDVTTEAGLGKPASTLGAVAADLDGDGWQDLYVANDGMANHMWLNRGDGTFVDEAEFAGTAYNRMGRVEAGMGVVVADIDRDLLPDLFVTHLAGESNTLYLNQGAGLFSDRTRAFGLDVASRPMTGFGAVAVDLHNDGWLDLVTVNGAVHVPEGAADGEAFPLRQPNQVFRNRSGESFEVVGAEHVGRALSKPEVSRGLAVGDLDDDGAADLVVVNSGGAAQVLRNVGAVGAAWVGIALDDPVLRHSARVSVRAGGVAAERIGVSGGSYGSANDPRMIFGLGALAAESVLVVVEWAPGELEQWRVPVGTYSSLRRGAGQGVAAEARARRGDGATGGGGTGSQVPR